MGNYCEINSCRIAPDQHLVSVLDLGHHALTGVFPKSTSEPVTVGPLELVWCPGSGLLQLRHSYEPTEMYGNNYGYRSGLNQSMVDHLTDKVEHLERVVTLKDGDIVVDIGSNDATLLKAYSTKNIHRIGIDPTGKKFSQYYPDDITLVPHFFSQEAYHTVEKKPAKIITSIAMFYDLESPVAFAQQIESILADDGIWHFEQSYMPSMLRMNSYDTICHEHLEYYSLGVVQNILKSAGLRVVDVAMNAVNGGSFSITATKEQNKSIRTNDAIINELLSQEDSLGLNTMRPFKDFKERVFQHRDDLKQLISSLNADGKKVFGYGASTKGNVVLQFCDFTVKDIPVISEVNPEKFGCFTPGTHIPIVSEKEAAAMNPDYYLMLPWHFKTGILKREKEYLARGGKFIIPFPEIEII